MGGKGYGKGGKGREGKKGDGKEGGAEKGGKEGVGLRPTLSKIPRSDSVDNREKEIICKRIRQGNWY